MASSGCSCGEAVPGSNHAPRGGRRLGISSLGEWWAGLWVELGLIQSPRASFLKMTQAWGGGGGVVRVHAGAGSGMLILYVFKLSLLFIFLSFPFFSGLLSFPQPTPSGRQREGDGTRTHGDLSS